MASTLSLPNTHGSDHKPIAPILTCTDSQKPRKAPGNNVKSVEKIRQALCTHERKQAKNFLSEIKQENENGKQGVFFG